jgi:hypothetical protein
MLETYQAIPAGNMCKILCTSNPLCLDFLTSSTKLKFKKLDPSFLPQDILDNTI